MKRFLSFLTSFLFLIWILPLGVFIKPSQEKEFCNGRRAICLCTKLMAKMKDQGCTKKIWIQNAPVKEEGPSAGFNQHFLLSQMSLFLKSSHFASIILQQNPYQFLLVRQLDPVPKVIFLS
jgi:hypothetical protein